MIKKISHSASCRIINTKLYKLITKCIYVWRTLCLAESDDWKSYDFPMCDVNLSYNHETYA